MLLEAGRKTISIDELNSICETHFKADKVGERLSLREEEIGLKMPLGIGTFSFKEKNLTDVEPRYSLDHYKEMLHEINHNHFAQDMRWDDEKDQPGIWIPFYKESEIQKELVENKFSYIGKDVDDKEIIGIGDKSIALLNENGEKEFHWFNIPKYVVLNKKYKNAYGDGYDIARAILRLHGDWDNDIHLRYILWSKKGHLNW